MEPPKPIKPRSWSDLDWYEEVRATLFSCPGAPGRICIPTTPRARFGRLIATVAEVATALEGLKAADNVPTVAGRGSAA
jgi:hypothetical protein